MKLRKDTRISLLLALVAVIVLLGIGAVVLQAVEGEYRRKVASHIDASLDSMVRLLDLVYEDAIGRAVTIAEEPQLKAMARRLAQSGQGAGAPQHAEFAAWIGPIYRSRGFEGYSLIAADRKMILTSGSPAYIGQPVTTEATRDALLLAERDGAAVARPAPAPRPAVTQGVSGPAGLAFQNACARIDDGAQVLGYLCLRLNPALRLYRILDAGRTGGSGEVYVIGGQGEVLSPLRFERELKAPVGAREGWSLFSLTAREPGKKAPLTRVAAAIIATAGDSGLIEDYRDYRGRRVVGAGRWLPAAGMGLIVEEDMEEAFRSIVFARDTLLILILIAAGLILTLSVLHWRWRRSLAGRESQLAAFRDFIPAAIHLKDTEGRYQMANPMFESIFGFSPGYAIGKTDAELCPPEERRLRQIEHEEVLRTGRPVRRTYTCPDPGPDGVRSVYSIVRFPVRGEDGSNIVAVGTVAVDVTGEARARADLEELTRTLEQKVRERTEELVVARDMAEAAGRAKAEFLANMSHEIRTQLNAIIGMSYLAAHVNAEPRVAHYVSRIQASGQHLLGIVNDILDLSKIEAGKLQIDNAEFSLEGLLEHVAGLVWERADAKGLELIIDIAPQLPQYLIGDAMRIGQILINFANNAVKFTEQGEIVLRVAQLEGGGDTARLRFEVEDTGIGIAEDKLPLLFSPFQQIDGSMSRRFEGTGLGLSISRRLAELMGGSVDVKSRLGVGSLFSFEVGLRLGDGVAMAMAPSIDLRNGHVLVVDDNAHARRQLANHLRALSFRVDEAASGQEAIGCVADADASNTPYEIVFVDGKMPGLSGTETAAQIRLLSLRGERPRMVLIAVGAGAADVAGRSGDFDAVLTKPVTPSELFDTVIGLFDPSRGNRIEAAADAVWPNLSGIEILLVEDNEINQEVVHDLLQLVGARVTSAADGLRALQLLDDRRFDALLMDVHMPIMNGFEATATIRRDPRFARLPIIALTANALEGDRERCLAAGMDDYVAKPIDPRQLFAALLRHLPVERLAESALAARPVEAAPPPADDSAAATVAALAALPELDTALGVSRLMGRPELYVQLARRIVGERGGLPEQIAAAQAAGDSERIVDLVHGIKSLLGTLGASELEARCVDLEARLQAGDAATAELAGFSSDYAHLIERLRASLPAGAGGD